MDHGSFIVTGLVCTLVAVLSGSASLFVIGQHPSPFPVLVSQLEASRELSSSAVESAARLGQPNYTKKIPGGSSNTPTIRFLAVLSVFGHTRHLDPKAPSYLARQYEDVLLDVWFLLCGRMIPRAWSWWKDVSEGRNHLFPVPVCTPRPSLVGTASHSPHEATRRCLVDSQVMYKHPNAFLCIETICPCVSSMS